MLRQRCLSQILPVGSLHISACLQKQPPHDRQRRRRKIVPPFHQTPAYDEDPFDNLKLEHLFPRRIPGLWGSTDPIVKEKFFKLGQSLVSKSTLYEKLSELYYREDNLWYHKMRIPLEVPETLEFAQFITRTNLLPFSQLPNGKTPHSPIDDILLSRTYECLQSYPLNPVVSSQERRHFLAALMECVYLGLVERYPDSHLCAAPNQIDNGAKVETFFKRFGFADLLAEGENEPEGLWNRVEETVLDGEGMLRFRILGELAWQFRSNSPLAPFVSASHPVCCGNNLPIDGRLYRPEVFGLEPTNHYDFSCLPFVNADDSPDYIRTVAGYWTDSPFWSVSGGDPCMFGLMGVLDITDISSRATPFDDAEIGRRVIERDALSQGLLTAFAWTSAMAYNQGYTLYNELDRPFSAQLLLYDGTDQTWQLVAYQLNSLSGLWKAEDAADPLNVAWHSDRIPLYKQGAEGSNLRGCGFIGLNVEAIHLISSTMLRAPEAMSSTTQEELLERRLIPSSTVEGEIESGTPRNQAQLSEHSEILSAAEQDALDAIEGDDASRKNHPLRVRHRPTPHPNEMFFLKLTQKADLLEEIRDKMPAFGGPRTPFYEEGKFPSQSKEALRLYRLRRRAQKPQDKVLKLPSRWR